MYIFYILFLQFLKQNATGLQWMVHSCTLQNQAAIPFSNWRRAMESHTKKQVNQLKKKKKKRKIGLFSFSSNLPWISQDNKYQKANKVTWIKKGYICNFTTLGRLQNFINISINFRSEINGLILHLDLISTFQLVLPKSYSTGTLGRK